jgi:multidrug efflux pump subunit AcrB
MGRTPSGHGIVVTLAVVLSALIALTLSPMMASLVLENPRGARHGRLYLWSERSFGRLINAYERGLKFSLRHRRITMTLNLLLAWSRRSGRDWRNWGGSCGASACS